MAGRVMQAGIGCKVSTADELDSWLTELRNNSDKNETIRQQALDFARRNVGATASVVNMIAYENEG
jgi:3-deoxy-D-manno-octulosonic-acid transferase